MSYAYSDMQLIYEAFKYYSNKLVETFYHMTHIHRQMTG